MAQVELEPCQRVYDDAQMLDKIGVVARRLAEQSGKPKLKNRCLVKNRTIALMNYPYFYRSGTHVYM